MKETNEVKKITRKHMYKEHRFELGNVPFSLS